MSATGRNKEGRERDPFDYYPTPAWCVARLLESMPWIVNCRSILDPTAGDGAIIRAIDTPQRVWTAWEIQERFHRPLLSLAREVQCGDALEIAADVASLGHHFDLAITNPPFHLAFALLRALWPVADEIILLLRMPFLASEERQPFLQAHPPAIRVLPNRPIFVHGTSDNADYAWMSWSPTGSRVASDTPDVRILNLTPKSVRCARNRLSPGEVRG